MTGLLGEPYPMGRASYELTRLGRNGLIERLPAATSTGSPDHGLAFAIFSWHQSRQPRVLGRWSATTAPQAPLPGRAAGCAPSTITSRPLR